MRASKGKNYNGRLNKSKKGLKLCGVSSIDYHLKKSTAQPDQLLAITALKTWKAEFIRLNAKVMSEKLNHDDRLPRPGAPPCKIQIKDFPRLFSFLSDNCCDTIHFLYRFSAFRTHSGHRASVPWFVFAILCGAVWEHPEHWPSSTGVMVKASSRRRAATWVATISENRFALPERFLRILPLIWMPWNSSVLPSFLIFEAEPRGKLMFLFSFLAPWILRRYSRSWVLSVSVRLSWVWCLLTPADFNFSSNTAGCTPISLANCSTLIWDIDNLW